MLKELKKNILSILVALGIMYLSLANSDTLNKVPYFNIPYLDKIAHFAMYFILMSVIIYINRKSLKSNRRLLLIAVIPTLYGILMEILQLLITNSRNASFYDAVFNSLGILISILLWLQVKPYFEEPVR